MSGDVRPTPYSRTRRKLPERVERLRWLRDSARDAPGCIREAKVDDAVVRVEPANGGLVEMRVEPVERADRLADEFFGRRYRTRQDDGSTVFIGRPL